MTTPLQEHCLIRIVDDDEQVRDALTFLLMCRGWKSVAFGSAAEFLRDFTSSPPGCLLLDIRMPGMTGVELQERMVREKLTLPIIFITGHADVATAVHTLKMGAFDFLQKPVEGDALVEVIRRACEIHTAQLEGRMTPPQVRTVLDEMSPREKEILARLAAGETNRAIADSLNLSERTVQGHRNNVYRKLRVHNIGQLKSQLGDFLPELAAQKA